MKKNNAKVLKLVITKEEMSEIRKEKGGNGRIERREKETRSTNKETSE